MVRPIGTGGAWQQFEQLAALETDECVVWPRARWKNGYGMVGMPGTRKLGRVHVLALERRVPRPHPAAYALHEPVVCHNKACMNYRHLRWGTPADNQADRKRDGTASANRGEANARSKLTAEQVAAIRWLLDAGEKGKDVAARFGVTSGTVSMIRNGHIWRR